MSVWRYLLFLGIPLLTACPIDPNPKPTPGQYPVDIPQTTKVADSNTRNALTSYDSSTGEMRFSSKTDRLAGLKANDILVSEPSPAAPNGYLRKVTAIRQEGDQVILQTTQAKLTEAVKSGSLSIEYTKLTPSRLVSFTPSMPGVTSRIVDAKGNEVKDIGAQANYEFERGLFYELGYEKTVCPTDNCTEVSLGAKGIARFEMGFKFAIDIGFTGVDRIESKAGINEVAQVGFEAKANKDIHKTYELGRYRFSTITFFIGPVPVVIQPEVVVSLNLDGHVDVNIKWGVSQTLDYQVGVRYSDSKWQNLLDLDGYKFERNSTFDISGNVKFQSIVDVAPALLFYDVGGPFFGLSVGIKLDAAYPRDPSWILGGLIRCRAGLKVDLGVLGVSEYAGEICSKDFELSRQPNRPPKITSVPQGTPEVRAIDGVGIYLNGNPDRFAPYYLQIKAEDPEDAPESLKISATSSRDGALVQEGDLLKLKKLTLGLHTIKITVTDSGGLSTNQEFTISVVAKPPSVKAVLPTSPVIVGTEVGIKYTGALGDSLGLGEAPLNCNQLSVKVFEPDVVVSANTSATAIQCSAILRFNTTGSRLVEVRGVDSFGQTISQNFNVSVQNAGPVKIDYLRVKCGTVAIVDGNECSYNAQVTARAKATGPQGATLSYNWILESGEAVAPKIVLRTSPLEFPLIDDATSIVALPLTTGGIIQVNPHICGLTPSGKDVYNRLSLTVSDGVNSAVSNPFSVVCSTLR